MDQPTEKDYLPEVLAAHNLHFEQTGEQLIIRKGDIKNASLQGRITLAAAGLVAGLLLFLFVSSRAGLVTMIASGSFLFAFMNLRQREKDTEKKSIRIDSEKIEIKEGYKSRRIKLEDITEFKTSVQQVKNLFVGKITIMTEDKWPYEFLEIFGTDEDELEEDLVIISNHIVDNYL